MTKRLFFGCIILLCNLCFAQNNPLSYSNYMERVLNNHPMVIQADLEVAEAKANLLKAKGNFDPYVGYQYAEKQYQSTEYYKIHEGKLVVPTGLGPTLGIGYEKAQGTYINPQWTFPQDGLINFGIDIPLLQGLWTDESRTLLRQAKIIRNAADVEKKLVLNQLVLFSTQQYWEWFEAFNKLKVQEKGIRLAKERFDGIKQGAQLGDLPFVDTLEANIQLLNRMVNYENTLADFKVNSINLSFFLWEDSMPSILDNTPPIYTDISNSELPNFSFDTLSTKIYFHPELNEKQVKIQVLEYEKQLAHQYFLPQVDLQYNPLADFNEFYSNRELNPNNYKLGLNIKIPVFYRKERGHLQSVKVYQEQAKLDMAQKRRDLFNKASGAYYELVALEKQVSNQQKTVADAWALLKAEEQRFTVGESSIFMVNTRENSYLNAENKLIELLRKQKITYVKYQYYNNEL